MPRLLTLAILATTVAPTTLAERAMGVRILLTGDLEGQVSSPSACCGTSPAGGLLRLTSVIRQARGEHPRPLVLDAGNAFFGGARLAEAGRLVATAFEKLAYDAVNVSYRDFRLGKQATLQIARDFELRLVSANLLDTETGDLLFAPYVVQQHRGRRVAMLGLTFAPASLCALPHLQTQLQGITVAPTREALMKWLPIAQAEAEDVLLLIYGTATGVRSVITGFENQLAAVMIAGAAEFEVSDGRCVVATPYAQQLKHINLGQPAHDNARIVKVQTIPIDATVNPDPEMERLLFNSEKQSN